MTTQTTDIPIEYKKAFCFSHDAPFIEGCPYYIYPDCPQTCNFAVEMGIGEDKGLAMRLNQDER